jgi:hypothetical protein
MSCGVKGGAEKGAKIALVFWKVVLYIKTNLGRFKYHTLVS